MSEDKPDFKLIAQADWKSIIEIMFANWNPLSPSKYYCESVGWPVNEDGTVDTPGGFRLVTSDRLEVEELEKSVEVGELKKLYEL